MLLLMILLTLFQSTPLRKGRQAALGSVWEGLMVSIHAPAKGATAIVAVIVVPIVVSIHAPAKGATFGSV